MDFNYESDNLIYRVLNENDAPAILNFYLDNKDTFEPFEPDKPANFYTLEYQESLAKLEYGNFLRGKSARFFIFRKNQPSSIVGCVSFNNIIKGSFASCTIGYKIHKHHHNLGYASEAVSYLVNMTLRDKVFHRIEAYILPDNTSSIALARKCNFEYDGVAKDYVFMHGAWRDHVRYTILGT